MMSGSESFFSIYFHNITVAVDGTSVLCLFFLWYDEQSSILVFTIKIRE